MTNSMLNIAAFIETELAGLRESLSGNDEGQGMVEYGLILALVAIGIIAVLIVLGTQARGIFDDAAKGLSGARTPVPTPSS